MVVVVVGVAVRVVKVAAVVMVLLVVVVVTGEVSRDQGVAEELWRRRRHRSKLVLTEAFVVRRLQRRWRNESTGGEIILAS